MRSNLSNPNFNPARNKALTLPGIHSSKSVIGQSLPQKSLKIDNSKAKKLFLRVSQKDVQEWQENWERFHKEELITKRTLKEINIRYNFMIQKYREKEQDSELLEERKQRQLERSILIIDGMLKTQRKKQQFYK